MKITKLLVIVLVFFAFSSTAQEVGEASLNMSEGTYNAFTITIPNADKGLMKDLMKDKMKENGSKPKKVKKSDDILAMDVTMVEINGAEPMNVYYQIEDTKKEASMFVWFDTGDGYLNSTDHPEQAREIEKFLLFFALDATIHITEDKLENEEDKRKDLEKDLKKLVKKNDNLHADIKKYEQKIKEAESDIKKNESDQEKKKQEIEAQGEVVEMVKEELEALKN